MSSRSEPRHIFHQSEQRHIHFLALEHADAFTGIGESHFLWSGNHYGAGDCQSLYESEVNVACAGRHIDDKVVEVAPIGFGDELLEGIACHAATPENRFFRVDQKTYRKEFYAIFFDWDNEVAAVDGLHIKFGIFHAEHFRHRWTEDIGIEQTHFVAELRQGNSEVGGDGGFAHTTFARRHADDVFHTGERIGGFFGSRIANDGRNIALDVDKIANKSGNGCFSRLDERLHKRVGGLVEDD